MIRNTDDVNIIEEHLELKKNQLNELKIEAEAAKLLYDLTEHYHDTAITSLTSPIEKLLLKILGS